MGAVRLVLRFPGVPTATLRGIGATVPPPPSGVMSEERLAARERAQQHRPALARGVLPSAAMEPRALLRSLTGDENRGKMNEYRHS